VISQKKEKNSFASQTHIVLRAVQPEDLGEAAFGSLQLGHDGGCVVASELGVTGSSRPRAGVLGVSKQGHSCESSFIVRAHWRADHKQQGLGARADSECLLISPNQLSKLARDHKKRRKKSAQRNLGGDQGRTNVEGVTPLLRDP